jgi:hypothetical protein
MGCFEEVRLKKAPARWQELLIIPMSAVIE